jgi:hypothetical protein
MPGDIFQNFSNRLRQYAKTDVTFEVLANFLRQNKKLQRCFQLAHTCCGKPRFIEAEKVFHYEHSSTRRIGDSSRGKLLHDIDEDEFYPSPLEGRIVLDEIENFLRTKALSLDSEQDRAELRQHLSCSCFNAEEVIADLFNFCTLDIRLPSEQKMGEPGPCVRIPPDSTREEIIELLEAERDSNPVIDLAFYAYRDLRRTAWKPFLKAALERNPACINALKDIELEGVAEQLARMENVSIYDGTRMAQPDEVWNFKRGDGLEKALCLMNIARQRFPQDTAQLSGDEHSVCVRVRARDYRFETTKRLDLPLESDFEF